MKILSSTKREPLVSIILPVYNGEKFLAQSIESCLCQTYENIELIIVNDCSTDNSLKIAENFSLRDERISIVSNTSNKQLPTSLNIGHEKARGEFFSWTSDDNYYDRESIEVLLSHILTSTADIVYSDFNVIQENGRRRKQTDLKNASPVLFGNSIGASFLYKKEVFLRNHGYDDTLHSVEDYDFWLRATLHSSFAFIAKSLYNFRSHRSSLSSKLQQRNSAENKLFSENIEKSYRNFLKSIGSDQINKFSKILTKIHLYEEIDVLSFYRDYERFIELLGRIVSKAEILSLKALEEDLDIRMRANIRAYRRNQNPSVLRMLLWYKPALLWKYDKKNSLRIVLKCLK